MKLWGKEAMVHEVGGATEAAATRTLSTTPIGGGAKKPLFGGKFSDYRPGEIKMMEELESKGFKPGKYGATLSVKNSNIKVVLDYTDGISASGVEVYFPYKNENTNKMTYAKHREPFLSFDSDYMSEVATRYAEALKGVKTKTYEDTRKAFKQMKDYKIRYDDEPTGSKRRGPSRKKND